MTNFKRFSAAVAATLMAACMVAPMAMNTSAAGETPSYSITIENENSNVSIAGKTYTAYKVLGLEYTVDETSGDTTGYKYKLDASCLNPDGYTGYTATDELGNLTVSIADATAARTFADMVYTTYIKDKTIAETVTKVSDSVATGEETITLNPTEPGYYIIVGASSAADGSDEITSLVMLDTADPDVTVNTKLDAPKHDKEILHNESSAWGDVGDNQIGDLVEYRITTTMPDPTYVKEFGNAGDAYVYTIHDKMTKGLDFDASTVAVTIGSTPLTKGTHYRVAESCDEEFETSLKTGQNVGDSFEIIFDMDAILADTAVNSAAVKGAEIVTTYKCKLTADALVASTKDDDNNSNDNTSYLEFSNNPYDTTTGETVEVTVYDWTFTYTVNKVDESEKPLAGATFNVESNNATMRFSKLESTDTTKDYYVVDANGSADIITTGKPFVLVGLDDTIEYKLIETAPPAGFNKCEPITFTITDEYEGTVVGSALKELGATNTQTGNNNIGTNNVIDVENKTGKLLPGTGGIGTTLFYLGGGAMVAVAGIYLISKKRMSNSEEE